MQIEHAFCQKHNADHMAEDTDMYDLEVPRIQFALAAQRHGGKKMTKNAYGKYDLNRKQQTKTV